MSEKKRFIPNDWQLKLEWNVKLFYFINSKRNKLFDKFYKYFYLMGKSYALPLFLPIFYLEGGIKALIHVIVSLILTGFLMPLIKYTFRHQRPYKLLPNVHLLEPVTLKSFPSADTALAFTLLGVILFYGSIITILIFGLYAVLIALGRVYMGAHFPIDVIVGAIIGILSALVSSKFSYLMNLIQNI